MCQWSDEQSQVGWESGYCFRLAGNQDNVSEWSRIMCLAGNQDNVSGSLGIRIMCLAGNRDNVSGWESG
jgi:hypothetical protein